LHDLNSVVADGVSRALCQDLLDLCYLLSRDRLALDIGHTGVFIAGEYLRRTDTTLVAVNAGRVHIVYAGLILREPITEGGHVDMN